MNRALFPDLVVNGERIPHAVVAAEAQNQHAPKAKPGIAWRKAANAIAIRTLLLQEAARRGLRGAPRQLGPGRWEAPPEALIRDLLEQSISVPPPDEAALKAEWQKDPARFRTPPLWEVSHILCACDPRDDTARPRALARATHLLAQARINRAGFADLAARESDCESKGAGGALGQVGPNDTVPEFEAALRAFNDAQASLLSAENSRLGNALYTFPHILSEPVLTRFGYHVIRIDAAAPGQVLPFDAVRDRIANAMEKAAWARQSKALVASLVKIATIEGADLS